MTQMLSNFELVLINGEVVQQDVGYNSMLGQLEPENWFWFENMDDNYQTSPDPEWFIVETYDKACQHLPEMQDKNKNIHMIDSKCAMRDYSVMCIPAKSILCIRKTNPWEDNEHLKEDTEQEIVPLSNELRRFSRGHGEIEEEESDVRRDERVATRRFERRRRPVIRKRNSPEESGNEDGRRSD